METVVKLGYKELKFRLLYWICLNNFYYYDVSDLEKEKLREKVKEWLVFYYSKTINKCQEKNTIQNPKKITQISPLRFLISFLISSF